MVNFCFEAAEMVVAVAIGNSEFDVVEFLLQGFVEEVPYDLGSRYWGLGVRIKMCVTSTRTHKGA